MNGSDSLNRLQSVDPRILEKPRPFDEAELGTLREFYATWEQMHALMHATGKRKKAEEMAQKLFNQALVLRRMYG